MGPFSTVFLAGTAFLATMMVIFNPLRGLVKSLEGMRPSDIEEAVKKSTLDQWVGGCFKYGCFLGLTVLVSFILEPIFVIVGVVSKVGDPLFGWVALLLVGYTYFQVVRSFTTPVKKPSDGPTTAAVVTSTGEKVEGVVINEDKPLPKFNWGVAFVKTVINFIPVLYLWYIFLINIGIAPSRLFPWP